MDRQYLAGGVLQIMMNAQHDQMPSSSQGLPSKVVDFIRAFWISTSRHLLTYLQDENRIDQNTDNGQAEEEVDYQSLLLPA